MTDVGDELRALIREVIRDVLPKGLPAVETVNLSTDDDLAAFVATLLDLDADAREDLRAGRKRKTKRGGDAQHEAKRMGWFDHV